MAMDAWVVKSIDSRVVVEWLCGRVGGPQVRWLCMTAVSYRSSRSESSTTSIMCIRRVLIGSVASITAGGREEGKAAIIA